MKVKPILTLLGCLLILPAPLLAADPPPVIETWNAEFLAAVRRQAPPPCLVARNLAILHLSVWRAVKGAGEGLEEAAVAGAAYEACTVLFAGDREGFERILKESPAAKGEAFVAGRAAAREVLRERENDGLNTTVHYHPDLAAGIWARTTNNRPPELPHWGSVKPFILSSASIFRPRPPPALDSERYAQDVNEVREYGGAAPVKRTPEQEQIARFWSDFSYTTSPAGRWNEITSKALEGNPMPLRDKAKLFAILNVAMADAGIACWECKYHYKFWRPVSAIHEDFDDKNPATTPDASWKSLLPAPSHPDYVSGHSTFSGAAATVLTRVLGEPKEKITVTNRDMPGVTRSFANYYEIAKEAGRSRIYGGIHYTSANEAGAELGQKVAGAVIEKLSE